MHLGVRLTDIYNLPAVCDYMWEYVPGDALVSHLGSTPALCSILTGTGFSPPTPHPDMWLEDGWMDGCPGTKTWDIWGHLGNVSLMISI